MDAFPAYFPLAGRTVVIAGEGEAAEPQRSGKRVAAAAGDRLPGADEDPRLGAAEELVAGEDGDGGSGLDGIGRPRLVGEQCVELRVVGGGQDAGTEVVDDRGAEGRQLRDGNLLDEAQVAALEGKVSFSTRYETRTRMVDQYGNEVEENGAMVEEVQDVEAGTRADGVDPETSGSLNVNLAT